MTTEIFDVEFYRAVNADLAGFSDAEATTHFLAYGLNEGRRFSPLVGLSLYQQLNGDLANFSNAELYNHLRDFGVSEGRQFSNLLDLDFYRSANSDLQGLNNEQLFDHLIGFGLNEQRRFSPYADLTYYRSQNADLDFLTGEGLLDHLVIYGLGENRRFSQFFDPSYYGTNNPDVATAFRIDRDTSASNLSLLNHFVAYGVGEGRESAQTMRTSFYRASYGDLQGLSNEAAYEHFQLYGVLEERASSDLFDVGYYLDNYGDLRSAGLNGLQAVNHYLVFGRGEGRFAIPNGSLLTGFEVFSGGLDVSGIRPELQYFTGSLAATDNLNPDRPGAYADELVLSGYTPGQSLRLTLDALDDSFDTYLQVINAATGAVVAFNDDSRSGLNSQIVFTPEQGVDYLARVTSFGSDEVGDYELIVDQPQTITGSLTFSDSPNPTRSGALADDFALTGFSPGQGVGITLNAINDSFDTYLQIVDATTGAVLAFDDDSGSGQNSQLVFTPGQEGNYVVRVTSFGANALGDYELIIDSDTTVVGNLGPGQAVSGNLSGDDFTNITRPDRYRDDYRIRGVAPGQQVTLNLDSPTGTDNFDTYLQVINAATGQVVGFDDDSGPGLNSEISFLAQADTIYLARVTSYSTFATGSYTLSADVGNPEIGPNQTIVGILDSSDPANPLLSGSFSDDYLLTDITAGQALTINVNSNSFDTYLYILDANNLSQIIASNDDANGTLDSEVTFIPQSGSNYLIRVSSFEPDATGSYNLTTTESETDWFTQNLQDLGFREAVRTFAADGVLNRNDMLGLFRSAGLTDGGTIDATEQQDIANLVNNAVRFRMPDYVEFLSQRVVEGATSNASAAAFDSNLVQRWFLGHGPLGAPTARFDSRASGTTYQLTFASVQGSLYSASGRPRIEDIDQGRLGDCAFLAALGGTFQRSREGSASTVRSPLIEEMILDNGDNTYTMRFYDNGTPNWVTVDRRLAIDNGQLLGARANGSADPNNPDNVLWAPLVERSYAQWREWREGAPGFNLIGNGDWPVNPIRYLTGRPASQIWLESTDQSEVYDTMNAALDNTRPVAWANFFDNSVFVGGHAYTVTDVYISNNGQRQVVLRNPWGVDGGTTVRGADDGYIDASYDEFRGLNNFNNNNFNNIGYQVA